MPYKDPEKRLQAQKEWRQSRTKSYMKWLYDRRAFRFWKAEEFERVLSLIAVGQYTGTPEELAANALREASLREIEVGRFYDHSEDKPTNIPSTKGGKQD